MSEPFNLKEAFSSFQRSAFRLERLDRYLVEGEQEDSFRHWLRTGALPEPGPEGQAWLGQVRAWTADGRTLQRVHVVTPPLTDYLRWELAVYEQQTGPAGEDIRVCDTSRAPWIVAALGPEFWLFDDQDVAECRYGPDGAWLGAVRGELPVSYYRGVRGLVAAAGVPVADYLTGLAATAAAAAASGSR